MKLDKTYQITWIILNAVKNLRIGKVKLAQFLKGSQSKNVKQISGKVIYGGLMWYDISTITGFIEQLENMKLIQRKIVSGHPYNYPILELTEAGNLVLEGKKQIQLQVIKKVKPIKVGDSEKETYKLITQGKNIKEISEYRNLALSTIYTHIFKLIVKDYIQSSDIIPGEIIKKVNDAVEKLSKPTVKSVKELLPEVSYEEIRCVLADLKRGGKNETRNFSARG